MGNSWGGKPALNGGRVFLVEPSELAPGDEGVARIEPLAPEFWSGVSPGQVIPMQEGGHVVGEAFVLEGPDSPIVIRRSQRRLSSEEGRTAKAGLSLLDLRTRRAAALEARERVADVVEFEVHRAWKLISCDGPPCCPNHWFVELGQEDFAELYSWRHLAAAAGFFPGRDVTLILWPRTLRILRASCSGAPVQVRSLDDRAMTCLNGPPGRAEILFWKRSELTRELRASVDAP